METVVAAATLVLTLMVGSSTTVSSSDLPGSRSVTSLKFIFVVSRHGNRGAHKDYALDPYPLNDPKFYPYGKGTLTPEGRVQTHKLGMKVRRLYDGFLNSTFYPEEIRATSSPTERSLMSGQCFLAGLYSPQGFQVWNKDMLWQPVPLYSTSPDNAHSIMDCQKYLVELEQSKIDFFKEYAWNVSEVMDYYKQVTGTNVSDTFVWYIWDKLVSERTEGYNIPDWTKRFYPEPMMGIIVRQFIAYYATSDTVVRLITGNLVEEMMVTMKKKIDGELQNRRMHLYSGHDSSIIPLLVALGVPRFDVPLVKPGSALLLELHEDALTSKHFVKVLFIDGGSVELDPQLLTLPVSDFSHLQNNTRWLFGLDYNKECLVPGSDADALISRNKWT